jgi:hypothetical protein
MDIENKSEEKKSVQIGPADEQGVRTKDNAIGIDDIGLPADVKPDGLSTLQDIHPDPAKTQDKT